MVSRQAPRSTEPAERSLDHPPARLRDGAVAARGAAHDGQHQAEAGASQQGGDAAANAVGEHRPERDPGRSETGLVGGLRGDVEYAITPAFRVGGLLRYDRAANWHEARGLLSARYRFGP